MLGFKFQLIDFARANQNMMSFGMLVAFDDLLVGNLSEGISSRTPLTYLMGLPDGSWICRKLIAASVETAGTSLTGISTRDSRRLPDQREGGAMTQTRTLQGVRIWSQTSLSQGEQK